MAMHLRQSTASQAVVIGPFVDSTDGNTVESGLTIDAADIRLSKNGANIVGKNSGGGTHDELGYYTITLDATDTNTVGRLQLMVHESGALPVYHEYEVLEEAAYDAIYASSADPKADINVASIDNNAITAASIATGAIDADAIADNAIDAGAIATGAFTAAKFAAGAIDAAALAADAGTEIAAAVWASGTRSLTVLDEDSTTLDLNATILAAVGLATGNLDTQLADIEGKVDDLESRLGTPSDLGSGATVAANLADIEGFVDNLTTIETKIDTIDNLIDTEVAAIKTVVDVIQVTTDKLDDTLEDQGGGVYGFTEAALQEGPGGGSAPTAEEIRQEIDSNSTQLAAIKAKTDPLTYTVANVLDSNIQRVNDVAVTGTGAEGDRWGVA